MPIGSPNKNIIATLIETLQVKVEPAKLYDLLKKMFADISKAYEALFEGPLPPNSGRNLDLSDIPRDQLPDQIAYKDEANVFSATPQTILALVAQLVLNHGTITAPGASPGRVGMTGDGSVYFARNCYYDPTIGWVSDNGGTASVILLYSDNSFAWYFWNGAALLQRFICDTNGVFQIGVPASVAGAAIGELVLENSKNIRASNGAASAALKMMMLDPNNVIRLGEDAAASGIGHVAIPAKTFANLPAAAAIQDGTIVLDSTNHRLCYYVGGTRRYLPLGTAF